MKSRYLVLVSVACVAISGRAQPTPCSPAWRQISTNAPPSSEVGIVAYDSRRNVTVLVGGAGAPGETGYGPWGVYEWDGTAWSWRPEVGSPPECYDDFMVMAYDESRGVCVFFGLPLGSDASITYEYDGTRWSSRASPRGTNVFMLQYPVMTYDRARKRCVLASGEYEDTWEWDGTNWFVYPRSPLGSVGVYQMAMAYDSVRRQTVLWALGDTWTWGGTAWTRAATNGPAARYYPAMAFDDRRGVMVMFGGSDDGTCFEYGDTWEWDGRAWSLQEGASSLGLDPRQYCRIWYDTKEERLVLLGGSRCTYSGFWYLDMWEERPPGYWVDFFAPGLPLFPETGYFDQPFNSLAEAVSAALPGCTINLKAGFGTDVLTISKPLTLDAFYGPATIGHQ